MYDDAKYDGNYGMTIDLVKFAYRFLVKLRSFACDFRHDLVKLRSFACAVTKNGDGCDLFLYGMIPCDMNRMTPCDMKIVVCKDREFDRGK